MPINKQIQVRRDTASNWTSVNPVLALGEAGLEIDTNSLKYGDGATEWNNLPYFSETTESIQIKRPLKTVNGESLEGNGNIQIDYNDLDNLPIIPTILTKHSELDLDDGTNPHGTTKNDVGLGNVPNLDTTDAVNKAHEHANISILNGTEESFTTALKNAYNSAVSWIITNGTNLINHLTNTSNPHNVTKSQVGLGDVDNTSDLDKPISIATQDALNLKLDKSTIPSKIYGTDISGNQIMISIDDFAGANDFPYTEITKAELDTLIANSELTKGFYKISGVNPTLYGGTTILVEVLEDNKLPIDAYGLFYNPKYDKTIDGYGVAKDYAIWKDESEQLESGVYAVGQNVIWGGKHWICIAETYINTKYIVDKFNLSTDYFQEVPFDDIDYNLVLDKIKYDYEYDLIIERNEKNSNIVSFSYDSLIVLSSVITGDLVLDNPIKSFQWGNLFDFDLQKGIGNNKVYDSINENINFTGAYQVGLNFDTIGRQTNLIFSNTSYQIKLSFSNYCYQNALIFRSKSHQNGLTFKNESSQSNLTFGNNSNQRYLTFTNQSLQSYLVLNDAIPQNNLVFNNYQRTGITITESESELTFDGNKHATKLTGNQFFTGKTTNDFAQIGDIPDTLALGETALTAYRGDRGKIAYDHSQATGNPHNTTKEDIGLGNVDNTSDLNKPISNATQNALNSKENSSNKVTDFTSPNNTTFPTTQAIINENKKATITVELINLLTTSFYAPNALRINSTALINGSGTITLKVNDVAYTLGNLIAQGAKITVETTTASVYNLIGIYE